MSENSWVLKGVDPSIREQAVEEAARQGVSLGDYLTDIVVRNALIEQLNAQAEADPALTDGDDQPILAPTDDGPKSYAVRHRLRGLERRLNTTVSGIDDTLFDLTSRIGEMEGVAADTAAALAHTQTEVQAAVSALQIDLADLGESVIGRVDTALGALADAQEARATALDDRVDIVETIARGAHRAAGELSESQEALKHAVAGDFADFAQEVRARLHTGLGDLRDASEQAAAQADAAIAQLLGELRTMSDSFEIRLEESAADTRARMHAAFSDAADRLGALAERVVENERFTARVTEQLRAQIADVEDGAQTALEETAETLRRADAALATDLQRWSDENDAALADARTTLSAEIVAVREDQLSHQARLKLVDAAVGNTINDLAETRETLTRRVAEGENQVRALLARAEADWNSRHNGAAARLGALEDDAKQDRRTFGAEIERVEACTHAALEKLARDIVGGDAALAQRLDQATTTLSSRLEQASEGFAAQLAQVRGQTEAECALVREEHLGALARLTLLDGALARLEGAAGPTDGRLARLEATLAALDPTLGPRLAELEAAAEETHALSQRVDAQRGLIQDTNEQIQDVARMLNRVATQGNEAAAKAHQLEMAIADMRLEQLAAAEKQPPAELLNAIERRIDANGAAAAVLVQNLEARVAAIETAQTRGIEQLTADIARFIGDNDRRLAAIETPAAAPKEDLAAAFEALRQRVEERIIGVEQRSVRMLEQVADTVALIEERFVAGQQAEAAARSA